MAPERDTHHLASWLRRLELEREALGAAIEATREAGADAPPHLNAPRLIDRERLRGLPAVGRGCSGAIRGTRPGDNLL